MDFSVREALGLDQLQGACAREREEHVGGFEVLAGPRAYTGTQLHANRPLHELGLPVGRIVVNGMLPPLFSREERQVLAGVSVSRPVSRPVESVLAAGHDRAVRERVQAEAIARLTAELPRPTTYLPLLFEEAAAPAAIRELAKRLL